MEETLSIIIPAHNEEKRIKKTLERYGEFFKKLKKERKLNFEIIIVINNTSDKTKEICEGYIKKYPEIKILNFKQGGKGFAVKRGFIDALERETELIGFVDADLATSPEAYYDLVQNIRGYDGIIASRYLRGAIVNPKQSFQRIIASRIFNTLIRGILCLHYRDTQCGAKIFKRKILEKIVNDMQLTHWAFDVNLLYLCKKHNFKIKEHPTTWEDKEYSKINLKKAGLQMLLSIIRLRLIYSPFKKVIDLYDKLV
jgi:glycosyltransferase involved in cell wall biosynthesis